MVIGVTLFKRKVIDSIRYIKVVIDRHVTLRPTSEISTKLSEWRRWKYSCHVRWNCFVAEISEKVASRLYFLKQLKRANTPAKDLPIFYLTCIRPVKEYACPVFHNALPAYLSTELEQLQKRAMPIIFPFAPYSDALHQANLETLSRRRQSITTKLFDSITCNSDHKLYELLPPRNNCESNLRQKRDLNVSLAKTKRLKNTFIYSNCN